MTSTTLISILVGVAVAALLVVWQLRAQPLNANFRLDLTGLAPRSPAHPGDQAQLTITGAHG